MNVLPTTRRCCCPDCSSSNVERQARPEYIDDRARLLRGFAFFLGVLGVALLIATQGVSPVQKPFFAYCTIANLGAAACCRVGAALRKARAYARCRQCGCLWRP